MNSLDLLPRDLGPRTFALVAGVESYDVSRHWNLRGPARDALRFARWLTGPGEVPPGHVRLLLSPLDDPDSLDWSDSAALQALRTTHRPATEANVKSVLFDELPACDGDLLVIFWAGHGYTEPRRGELMLPSADARPGQIRHLNLDSALRWWRTSLVKRELFRYQAALVDACRVDAPRDARWNFGTSDYGGGATVPGRRQFRLYASREGEAAKNDAERGAGRFTEELLAELGERPVREAVTGLADTARSIHRTFLDLRERGEGWQLPQFVVDRDWDACSFLDFPDDGPPGWRPRARAGSTRPPGTGSASSSRTATCRAAPTRRTCGRSRRPAARPPPGAACPATPCWRWSRTSTNASAGRAGCRSRCPSYGSSRNRERPATSGGRPGCATG